MCRMLLLCIFGPILNPFVPNLKRRLHCTLHYTLCYTPFSAQKPHGARHLVKAFPSPPPPIRRTGCCSSTSSALAINARSAFSRISSSSSAADDATPNNGPSWSSTSSNRLASVPSFFSISTTRANRIPFSSAISATRCFVSICTDSQLSSSAVGPLFALGLRDGFA